MFRISFHHAGKLAKHPDDEHLAEAQGSVPGGDELLKAGHEAARAIINSGALGAADDEGGYVVTITGSAAAEQPNMVRVEVARAQIAETPTAANPAPSAPAGEPGAEPAP